MAATALVSARLDPQLKERAEMELNKADVTATEVIRRVYEYIVVEGEIPTFIKTNEYDIRFRDERSNSEKILDWLDEGPLSSFDFSWLTDEVVADELAREASTDA